MGLSSEGLFFMPALVMLFLNIIVGPIGPGGKGHPCLVVLEIARFVQFKESRKTWLFMRQRL